MTATSNIEGSPGGYVANAFHTARGGRTIRGRLSLTDEGIVFSHDEGAVSLPWSGLRLRIGGHNDEQIFFEHPQQPEWTIYTADPAVAKEPALRSRFAAELRVFDRRRKRVPLPIILGVVFVIFFVGTIVAVFSQRDRIVRWLADKVPVKWEIDFGNQIAAQIQRDRKVISDAELEARLASATERLLAGLPQTGYAFQFHLVDDTNVNAFAIPGGHVFVHTGLIRASKRPEELAGVLAHEIAHVTEKHGFRKIIDSAGIYLAAQVLIGDATGLLAAISEGSQLLLRQTYSREFEREADNRGWDYLIAAQIDPRGMIEFFKTLKAEHEMHSTGAVMQLLNTHPTTDERIDRLEDKWRDLSKRGPPKFVPIESPRRRQF